MKRIVIIVIVLFTISCNSSSHDEQLDKVLEVAEKIKEKNDILEKELESKKELTEGELKDQLRETECDDPTKYLYSDLQFQGRYKGTFSLKFNGIKIELEIKSKATLITYKDLEYELKFLSKTGATVLKKTIVVYEYVKPNSTTIYKTEIDCTNQEFNDIERASWKLIDAACKKY